MRRVNACRPSTWVPEAPVPLDFARGLRLGDIRRAAKKHADEMSLWGFAGRRSLDAGAVGALARGHSPHFLLLADEGHEQ